MKSVGGRNELAVAGGNLASGPENVAVAVRLPEGSALLFSKPSTVSAWLSPTNDDDIGSKKLWP